MMICMTVTQVDRDTNTSLVRGADLARGSAHFGSRGSWCHIYSSLQTLPKLSSLSLVIREPEIAHYAYTWRTYDHQAITRRLEHYFTSRLCRGLIKDLKLYLPILKVKHLAQNQASWECDPQNQHHAAQLERKLKARGMRCKVLVGSMLTLDSEP
jgi:hypothetical protein